MHAIIDRSNKQTSWFKRLAASAGSTSACTELGRRRSKQPPTIADCVRTHGFRRVGSDALFRPPKSKGRKRTSARILSVCETFAATLG